MSRLLVTGCGRSGTAFAANALRYASVKCGHEDVFKLTAREYIVDWNGYGADASWCAVPHLAKRQYDRVVLLVRHPLPVIRSWMELDLLGEAYDEVRHDVREVVYGFRHEVRNETTQLNRCAAMWLQWNQAALFYADEIVHMETMVRNPDVLLHALNVEAHVSAAQLGVINAKTESKCEVSIKWTDVRPALHREVDRLARGLGYYY